MDVVNSLHRAARSGNLKRVLELVEDDLVDINASNNNGLTVMHSACKEGHTRIVEELLARGANVQARTLKGNQPIHIASLAGHEPVVRVLLDNGADVNAQSTSGFTSLYMAAQENHESIVRLLLERGADQNISTIDGFTPLAVSLQQNHENIAKILLSHEARGQVRFPGVTDTGRSLLHVAAKKNDCAAAALLLQNNISADITSKSNFTSLHVACHYGNEAVAKLLIDNGADVNYQAKQNITPLHVAARWNQCDMVNLLLDNGAKIDARTKDHLTPLHCAARMGHDACVELLIARGAPISAKTRSHLVPLHMSAQGNHLRSAQILLNNRAPVDDVTIDHLTSLHVASHCGHVKVAKLLLDHKADPNLRAQNGFTSLHIACKKNHLEIVKLLIKYGASLKAVTESGLSCLHIASFMGCVEIVIYLLDHKADIEAQTIRGETPLILATRSNQLEVIDVLLRYGANANACDQNHQNALHLAARLGNAKIAKLLIDRGIDINAPTRQMYTALHIASKENHENVVALMLDHGANILCATRNHEFLPLHLASKYGNDRIVELLLDYGAPVDARGKNDVTSLMVASHYDHPRVVELLLSFGASPHAIAKNGYTAIHIAAKGNRIDCAHTLLQNGADPNVESKAGFCPLHLASQEGRADMAALLLDSGAQVNCRAKNGITPLHLCAQEDHVNVAQLLVKYGAILDAQTRNGFTPLHVACHFTRLRMIRFLLANGADVNIPAASGYTSLHQASQQGNSQIVALLLEYNAQPGALTDNGHSALSIAENLGHVSVIDTLRIITETVIKTTKTTITEEKFKIVAPETMQETFVSDSEDEADDTPAHQETVRFLTTDVMRSFNANNTMASEDNYNTSQSNIAPAAATRRQRSTDREDELAALAAEQQLQLQQQQQMAAAGGANQQATRPTPIADEMSQDLQYLSREAPLDGGESTFGAYSTLGGSQLVGQQRDVAQQQQQLTTTRTPTPGDLGESQSELENDYEHTTDFRITGDDGGDETNGAPLALVGAEQLARQQQRSQQQLEQLAPDNVDIQRPLQQAGLTVSFMSTTTMDEELQRAAEGEMLRADGGDSDPADSGQPIGAPLIDCELELEPGEQNKANQPLAHLVEPATRPKSALSATRHLKPFLVSFMVDARGGAMRGCRHSGVRVIIPPNSAPQPMRITCRYLRRERLVHPPPLMEGEACASKIMEVGPAGAKFLGPVLIEVPHFASLRGKEREIIILRSDSGEVWREHLVETDDELIDSILHSAELVEQQQQQENNRPVSPAPGGGLSDGGGGDSQQQQEKRLTRIVTTEFPQYFAIISRIRQEVHTIGPDGSVVDSQVVPRVQAIFTDGALTKRIKIGLQKKDASTEQVQDGSEEFVGEDRARSPTSAGRPGSSAGKRRSRFLACFGGKHGSQEFGLDQQATDGELGFASGSNDDSPASSTGGDSPRHQHAVGANGKPLVGGGHRRVADVSDSEGDSLTLERQQRVRGPPHRRRSLVAGELVPEDYYIEREPALILNVEPKTYGKRMASSSAQTDSAKSGNLSTSTKQKGRRGLLLGARRSRSKTPMQIPFYEQEQEQSSQNNNKRPKSTDPGASTAYSSLESNGGDHEPDNGVRSSLSDLSEVGGATSTLPEVSKFRTCTVQTDSDSVTVQYVTLAAMPADASKVLSATTTTGGVGGLDDGYVSGSGDAKKASLYQQQSGAKKSFLSSCVSTGDDNESSPSSIAKRKGDKKGRGKSSDRARTLESVRESAGSTEPGGRRSVSLSRAGDSPTAGKLVETITTTTTTTMSQFLDAPTAATGDETLSNGEEADESLLTSTHSGGKVSPSGAKGAAQKKKLSKAEKVEKLRLKELERQRQRELEAAEKARKKAEKEARKEAERLEKLERKSGSRAQSPAPTTAEQRPQVITSDSEGNTLNATTTKVTQNVKFAPSPNKDYRSELQREEVSDELVATPEVDEQQVSPTSSESEKTSSGKSKGGASSKFKIKLPKISLGGGGGGKSGSVDPNEETTTIERVITREEFVPPAGQVDEDNSLVHVSIGDATVAEPKVAAPSDEEAEDKHQLVTSSTVESQTTTSSPHIAETQEIKQVAVPLKPILKHQQSTVSEVSEEPRSLASLADRVVTKATQEAVRELDQTEGQMVTTVTTSEISTSNFRTSAETISVSESKREQARRIKAEKERRKAERDQVKLEMKIKHEEEKRLLKDAQRAAKQAEEAAKRAEQEAKRASTLARVEAERQAQIAQVESERTIREIEAREASQSSEAPTTSSGEKTKVKKAKKQKKSKVPKEEADTSVERVEKETKTETSEFFLKGEQPQEGQVVASSLITSEQPRTDTPTSSTNSKKISIGLPKISLDLGRKKRQVSQDEAPAEQAEPVASDEQITTEAKPETGLEQLITSHEEPTRPPSPTASKKKQKKVRAKPSGMRMNCFRGRRPASSASNSTEDLTKSRADKQVEVTRETTEEQIEPKPTKEKKGKMKARSKKDKEEAARKRDRRASETAESQEQEPSVERTKKSRGFLSRIFRPRSPRARSTSPKQRQVELIRSQEESHFDLPKSKQVDREQIVSEMYPSDPNNADGEMILEVNVPEELIREHQQPSQGDLTVTKTSHLGDVGARPESPPSEQPPSQQQVDDHVTSTTAPTFATSEDQEATLVNVSQLAADEEADEDEATENVVSQTQELPRDQEPVAPVPAPVPEHVPAHEEPPTAVESDDEKVEVTRVITEEQIEEPSESKEVTREVLEQVENVPDPKREKERKELEAKLEKEAKKRAKEDEKLRKKREKEEAKLAVLEAKRAAKEEKERVKREASEAKRLAELAKRESKRASKTEKKTVAAAAGPVSSQVATTVEGEQGPQEPGKPTTITTTTITTSSTTQGDESALNTQLDSEAGERVLASSSTSEVPVNEETEVERIVEEVMGEDGTMTKTTKVVETKYVTMRQEEVRVAERKDIPREEWERIQAERIQPSGSGQQQVAVVTTSGRTSGSGDIIETYRTQKHYIVREPSLSYPTPELDEIRATPSYFDPAQLPAEIKPQTSIKKQFAKRVRLNQRIIKRAQKLSRSEAKKAKRDQWRAESEIAVCDCAARQARKELKRAVQEAKRAVKEAEKRHKKMDKIDKEIAKRQKKLEKRQKKIDKKLAKLAKKQAKKQAKLEKKALKGGAKRSSSSSKSIRIEDIGAPVLRSSSRASIQQLAAGGSPGSSSGAAVERHLIITEEGTRTHVMRQSSQDSQVSNSQVVVTRSPETIIVDEAGGQHVVDGPAPHSGTLSTSPEVPMSLDDATLMVQQEQQQLAHRESIGSASGGQLTGGGTDEQQEQDHVERFKREAEHAAAMQRELEAAREEDDEVIDVVNVDEDKPEEGGESVETEISGAQPAFVVAKARGAMVEHKLEQEPEQQENEPPVDVEAQGADASESQEQEKQDSSNGGTPSKKSKKNKKKKQKSTESAS